MFHPTFFFHRIKSSETCCTYNYIHIYKHFLHNLHPSLQLYATWKVRPVFLASKGPEFHSLVVIPKLSSIIFFSGQKTKGIEVQWDQI